MARNSLKTKINLFLGSYEVTITSSFRVVVPPDFRKLLGSSAILTKGFEDNLLIVPVDKWETLVSPLRKSPLFDANSKEMTRYLVANSYSISLDQQGRFVVPVSLRGVLNLARVPSKLVVAGMLDYIEIWPVNKWNQKQVSLVKNVDKIAKVLNERE